LIQHL